MVEQCKYNDRSMRSLIDSTLLFKSVQTIWGQYAGPQDLMQSDIATIDHPQHLQTLLPTRSTTSTYQPHPKPHPPLPLERR